MTEKRFYCDDPSEYRSYAIADVSKSDKTKEDFLDENKEIYDIIAFDDYLWDKDCYMTGEKVCELLNEQHEEIQFLKDQLNDITFNWTQNYVEFDKDKLYFRDNNVEIDLKNGNLQITVFLHQIKDVYMFNYIVTGRRLEREIINSRELQK